MSFEAIITAVESLPATKRRKLMAIMIGLQTRGRTAHATKLAKKIDDRSPGRWLTAEQCEKRLGLKKKSR